MSKRGLFDFLFSLMVTFFAFISFFGLLIFLVIGLTIGIFDWGVDEILCMVFAVFLPVNVISFLMMLSVTFIRLLIKSQWIKRIKTM